MIKESIEILGIRNGGLYVDATLGAGGHAEAILSANQNTEVIGFDVDALAHEICEKRLREFAARIRYVRSNFSNLREELNSLGIFSINGLIADLGVSSMQLDNPERGFAFKHDAPLDMRMDTDSELETAAQLLARLNEEEIANIIFELGEERFSRRIAKRIVSARRDGKPIKTTRELADLVRRSVPRKKNERVHPATKTFQALRIKVNRELEILENFVTDTVDFLVPGGRMAVITFHSLEDRIIKRTFQKLSGRCSCPSGFPQCVCGSVKLVEILTRKPIAPSPSEQSTNPRSRSAKLRACRKLDLKREEI